ncbi:MAG: acyl-CoA dehydrogenase family protein, partial [Alphaproteobacteria bacterium]
MDLSFSPRTESFRAELRAWLAVHAPRGGEGDDAPEFATLEEEFSFLRDWQRELAGDRWVGVHWPEEFGGRGGGPKENSTFPSEMAFPQAPEVIPLIR